MFSNGIGGGQSQREHETIILLFYLRISFTHVNLKGKSH